METSQINVVTKDTLKSPTFLKLPKFILSNKYSDLSCAAKFLYTLIYERHLLSAQNNWVNKSGEIYLIYTREQMMSDLNLSKNTVTKLCDQLKQFNLIKETSQGKNKPNLIYLLTITDDEICYCNSNKKTIALPKITPYDSQSVGGNKNNKNNNNYLINETKKQNIKTIKIQSDLNIDNNLQPAQKHYALAITNVIEYYLNEKNKNKPIYINQNAINKEEFKHKILNLKANDLNSIAQNIDITQSKYRQAYITTILYNYCNNINKTYSRKKIDSTYNHEPSYKMEKLEYLLQLDSNTISFAP